jgi:hypothetical protein
MVEPGSDVRFAELCGGQLRDAILSPAGAIYIVVVDDNWDAIARKLHVELDAVGSRFDRKVKSGQSVLGS